MNRLNPQTIIQQAMNNSQMMQNPVMRNAIEMYQKKDTQGLNELASNLCKEKGTTLVSLFVNKQRKEVMYYV